MRILFVGSSRSSVETLIGELCPLGLDPRFTRVEDEGSLVESLGSHSWDLSLVDDDLPDLPIGRAAGIIHDADSSLPVVALCSRGSEADAIAAMGAGGRDYVMRDDLRRLGPVVQRELADAAIRRDQARFERALIDSEARFRAVVEDQTEFVVRWHPDGTRTFVNRAYCDAVHGSPAALLGTSFMDGMRASDRAYMKERLADLSSENPVVAVELRVPQPDGDAMHHEWVNRGVFDPEGELVEIQSVGRDVTEQRKAGEAERQHLLLVEVLRDTAAALNTTLDLDEVFDRILANIGWVIPHNASAIFFAEEGAARVVRRRGWDEVGGDSIPDRLPLSPEEMSALSMMMESGKPIVIQNTVRDSQWNPENRRLQWVRSFAAAPLFDESKLFGILALFCKEEDYFTDVHIELLEGFASQAASATRNARLYEATAKSRRDLQALSSRIVEAQEEERRRLSRELHDEIGQALTALIINVELLLSRPAGGGGDEMATRLGEVTSLAKEALNQVRNLSHRLRPAMLDELGLVPTLEWFARRYGEWSGLEVRLNLVGINEDRVEPAVETVLYRVIQEALTNVVRHAEASRVEVELIRTSEAVFLRIEDDGLGFDPDGLGVGSGAHFGVGLLGMKERVTTLGGRLTVSPSETGGVRLDAEVPLVRV